MDTTIDSQFWSGFHHLVSIAPTATPDAVESSLNQVITLVSSHLVKFLSDEPSLHHAISSLLHSPLFQNHVQRSTNLVLLSLIDPTTPLSFIFVTCLTLLLNGFENPVYFRTLRALKISSLDLVSSQQNLFTTRPDQPSQLIPVLLAIGARIGLVPPSPLNLTSNLSHLHQYHSYTLPDLIDPTNESYSERKLKPLIAGLLYELCRVQKLEDEIINLFSEQLIGHLFELVELTRDQEDETLNYNLIKLIIALNEQFMIAGLYHPPQRTQHNSSDSEHNIVIRIMKQRLNESKTFGENLIFILNRASHSTPEGLCVSLLILKILYLLFTTPGTHEYFYKNDLCVLVDIFIRELSNLPDEHSDLRHTYLRVLHPLLTQTQLRTYGYKRGEIHQVLLSHIKYAHLQELNPTTQRLIQRNLQSEWFLAPGKNDQVGHQKPDLPRLRPYLKRVPSQDTLESQLSGGSSFAEVTSSNAGNKILNVINVETPVNLVNFPQHVSSSSPSTSHSTSQPMQILSHHVVVDNDLESPLGAQDRTQDIVQVIIADAEPTSSSEGQFNPPISASSTSSSEPITLPSSHLTTSHVRPVSPISEGSPRPSSSGSFSHSPARRPAPKPPILRQNGQTISSQPQDKRKHASIIQHNPQIIKASNQVEDGLSYSLTTSSSLSLVNEYGTIADPMMQNATSTSPYLQSNPEERRIGVRPQRRKAPLPPPNQHGMPSLRGTKSISNLNSHSSSSNQYQHSNFRPANSNLKSNSNRIVSLSTHFSPPLPLPPPPPPSSQLPSDFPSRSSPLSSQKTASASSPIDKNPFAD